MFQDGFATSRSDKNAIAGHDGAYLTLAEFDFDSKWDTSSFHAILHLFIHSGEAKSKSDPNYFLRLLDPHLKKWPRAFLCGAPRITLSLKSSDSFTAWWET
jgi:hypothetical protein